MLKFWRVSLEKNHHRKSAIPAVSDWHHFTSSQQSINMNGDILPTPEVAPEDKQVQIVRDISKFLNDQPVEL